MTQLTFPPPPPNTHATEKLRAEVRAFLDVELADMTAHGRDGLDRHDLAEEIRRP